ncbi:MAG: AAA family ATPase [Candidatus Kariarchaeaceae archaeon]|jgi:transitional endoplasmic reticulum ATPase
MSTSRQNAIEKLNEIIKIPLLHPELYQNLGVAPPKAVLLYGVTGSGKTYLIREATKNAKAHLYQINLGSATGAQLLEQVKQATSSEKPTVLYLVMHNPELISKEVITMLSKILDGETDADLNQTVIAGSSVRPALPSELRRPGRFTHEIYIGLPDIQERYSILNSITENSKLDPSVNLKELANLTRGYTPADLHHLLNTAAQFTIKRNFIIKNESIENQDISQFNLDQTDFLKAIQIITPTVYNEFGFSMSKITWEDLGGHNQIKNTKLSNQESFLIIIKKPEFQV